MKCVTELLQVKGLFWGGRLKSICEFAYENILYSECI